VCSQPESHWVANSFDDSGCEYGGHHITGKAIQPRQEQSYVQHPAAVILAMVDWINDLPEMIKRVDNHGGCYSMESRFSDG